MKTNQFLYFLFAVILLPNFGSTNCVVSDSFTDLVQATITPEFRQSCTNVDGRIVDVSFKASGVEVKGIKYCIPSTCSNDDFKALLELAADDVKVKNSNLRRYSLSLWIPIASLCYIIFSFF